MTPNNDPATFSVSIHVPAKGTTAQRWKSTTGNYVSIHVPAKGTTIDSVKIIFLFGFQSTFPRRERRSDLRDNAESRRVSIHVPAKDRILPRIYYQGASFNPRSREGNDGGSLCRADGVKLFQSTFPRRERRQNHTI